MTMKRGLSLGILTIGLSACITPFDPLVDVDPEDLVGSGHITSEVREVSEPRARLGARDLEVVASGASQILYRGDPSVTSSLSGAAAVSRW